MENRRIDYIIIKTFALCFLKMAESFENLADWENEDLEKSLAEAVDSYDKQEEEKKTRFSACYFCVPLFCSYHILTSSITEQTHGNVESIC